MKIDGVIKKDEKANVYFAYVRQFPGICAQADTIEAVKIKIDKYFGKFIDQMSRQVDLEEADAKM